MFLHKSAWPRKEQALQLAVSLRKWLDTQVREPQQGLSACMCSLQLVAMSCTQGYNMSKVAASEPFAHAGCQISEEATGLQVAVLLMGAERKEAQLPAGTMPFLATQFLPVLERMDNDVMTDLGQHALVRAFPAT